MRPVGPLLLRSALAIGGLVALASLATRAPAELRYRTTGDDVYAVGTAPPTHILYTGTQSLTLSPQGSAIRFVAQADCTRDAGGVRTPEHARFVQDLLANGVFEDRADEDPDFLTVLNQPFAIRLDAATVADLQSLHEAVPFTAASPVGGGDLRGALRPGISGTLQGRPVVGVQFQAQGTIDGPVPGRVTATIRGRIHLDGTAYYGTREALLLALDARLTIEGALAMHRAATPVRIVYNRSIKIL